MARSMGHLMWLIRWLYSFSSSVSFRPGWVLARVWNPRPMSSLSAMMFLAFRCPRISWVSNALT